MEKKDIYSIYILKSLCSLVVILLHCPFSGFLGRFITYFLRFPVPVFFMISGYFCKDNFTSYKNKIISTAKLIFVGETICALIRILISRDTLYNFANILFQVYEMKHVVQTVLFGTFFNGTLWYLYAAVWTYVVFAISKFIKEKFHIKKNIQIYLICILLAIEIVGRIVCQSVSDINEWIWVFRSFLLQGIPFMLIGKMIRKHEKTILSVISIRMCLVLLFLSYLLAFGEYMVVRQYLDVYLSTVIIAFLLFVLSLHKKDVENFHVFTWMGKNLTAYMYIFHLPVIEVIETFVPQSIIGGGIKPVLTVISTILVSTLWYFLDYICHHINMRRM